MKLQNMAIILIIIIVPITLVLSQYMKLQVDTISIQSQYATKLKDATYDAIAAFQVNTVHNEFSTVSDSMRRDIAAAIQTFTSTLAQNLGMPGASENYIMPYIPAIVFTLYDGYYIYAPSYSYTNLDETNSKEVDDGYTISGSVNKNADNNDRIEQISTDQVVNDIKNKSNSNKQLGNYEHVLKPYIYYTVRYKPEDDESTDFVVNYSLDNYVVIYGKIKGTYITKAGYLVAEGEREKANLKADGEILKRVLPVTTLAFADKVNKTQINDQAVVDVTLQDVEVTNKALLADRLNTGYSWEGTNQTYKIADAYSQTNAMEEYKNSDERMDIIKRLLEFVPGYEESLFNDIKNNIRSETDRTLAINPGSKVEVTIAAIESNTGLQKKYYNNNRLKTDRKTPLTLNERYLAGTRRLSWFIGAEIGKYESKSSDYYVDALSANKYYDEGETLTKWVNTYLKDIKASDAMKPDGTRYKEFGPENIFNINANNDPSDDSSIFNTHKRDVIRDSIQDNLSQAIASYSEHSEALKTTYDYRMPILSETEWDQVLKNVSMITFMQGIKAGSKIYNDYTIVTSTKNKEYVSPDSLFFINNDNDSTNNYYHKIGCSHLNDENIIGYKNTDFDPYYFETESIPKVITDSEGTYYEYSTSTSGELQTDDKTTYYYMHSEKDGNNYKPYEACYYCIVNSTKEGSSVDWKNNSNRRSAYFTTLAREKYNFYKTNSYLNVSNNTDEQLHLRQEEADLWTDAREEKLPDIAGLKYMGVYNRQTGKYEVIYYREDEDGNFIEKVGTLNQTTEKVIANDGVTILN